jgi:outer membrane protein assembly factor BamA
MGLFNFHLGYHFGKIASRKNPYRDRLLRIIIFIFFIFFISTGNVNAQNIAVDSTRDSITIDHIFIIGNRVTKEKIIRRELSLKEGDSYPLSTFGILLKRNEEKITNTSLFISVNISKIDVPVHKADIIIRVVERWYLFPIPVLELADRNFNDWWVNHNHDFRRIEWGLRLTKYNMRGMNETLKLIGQFGYTKRFYISYNFPYINRKQKTGLNLFFDYALNKNMNYATEDNKLVFLNSNHWLKEYYNGGLSFTLRKSFYTFHTVGALFMYNKVNDTIPELNPHYFNNGKTDQKYIRLYYIFLHDKRDIAAYPLHGSYFYSEFDKFGIGFSKEVNFFQVSSLYFRYLEFPWKLYFSTGIGGRFEIPGNQPYNLYNSMGYGQFAIRGYELYVIDGKDLLMNKYTLKRLIFKTETDYENYFSPRQIQHFHLALYLKTFADFGYVWGYDKTSQSNPLGNQLLYGYGLGIDIFTVYDILFKFEYSFNKSGENGLVFSFSRNF